MFEFVYLLNFIFLLVMFFALNNQDGVFANIRAAFIKSLILMAFLTVATTEILSCFNRLSFLFVFYTWLVFGVGFLVVAWFLLLKKGWHCNIIRSLTSIDRQYVAILAGSFFLIIVPLVFLALFYPINNSDSLSYHLPRIEHWIQNCSVRHYITSDIRQLYTPPLPEFLGLHLRVLANSDVWLNLIQFFAMLGSMFLVSLGVRSFGYDYKYQILGMLLTLSIPMGILQATTTQTDYIAAFFLAAFLFFIRLFSRATSCSWLLAFWAALSLGLGFLTKPTIGFFAMPFALLVAFICLRKWRLKAVFVGFVFVFFILFINMPFWMRNYQRCGNFLGDRDFVSLVQNKSMNGRFFVSNVLRNVSTHLALPWANSALNKVVVLIHQKILRISPEERAITFGTTSYEPFFYMHEDHAGNFFILLFLLFLIGYFLLNLKTIVCVKNYFLIFYFLSLLSGYCLFCFMLKWQPWITRLDLPFFIITIPFMVYVVHDIYGENGKWAKKMNWVLMGLLCYWFFSFAMKDKAAFVVLGVLFFLIYYMFLRRGLVKKGMVFLFLTTFLFTIPYVYFNPAKPLISKLFLFSGSRERRYFGKNEKAYKDHLEIVRIVKKFGISAIGILSPNHIIEKKVGDGADAILLPNRIINEYWVWAILKNNVKHPFVIKYLSLEKNWNKENALVKDQFFKDSEGTCLAVIAYTDNICHLLKSSRVVFWEKLGTVKEPLFLIVLQNRKE